LGPLEPTRPECRPGHGRRKDSHRRRRRQKRGVSEGLAPGPRRLHNPLRVRWRGSTSPGIGPGATPAPARFADAQDGWPSSARGPPEGRPTSPCIAPRTWEETTTSATRRGCPIINMSHPGSQRPLNRTRSDRYTVPCRVPGAAQAIGTEDRCEQSSRVYCRLRCVVWSDRPSATTESDTA